MFRIWKDRRVYSNAFLKELELLIEPVRKTQVNEPLPDFKVSTHTGWVFFWWIQDHLSQLPLLQDALSEFSKFEAELKVKSSHLSNLRVDITNPTTSLSMLKGKPLSPHLPPNLYTSFNTHFHRQISWWAGVPGVWRSLAKATGLLWVSGDWSKWEDQYPRYAEGVQHLHDLPLSRATENSCCELHVAVFILIIIIFLFRITRAWMCL